MNLVEYNDDPPPHEITLWKRNLLKKVVIFNRNNVLECPLVDLIDWFSSGDKTHNYVEDTYVYTQV